ncbi:hypothetical protein [Caldicellulosiruptor bescii]|jgi:hypothetical protein|nr:hypothetical protein [Caldicellulosiruptor bescii]
MDTFKAAKVLEINIYLTRRELTPPKMEKLSFSALENVLTV